MANKIVDQVLSLTAAVKDLKKEIDSIGPSLQKMGGVASKALGDAQKAANPVGGTNNIGSGPGQGMGIDNATFGMPSPRSLTQMRIGLAAFSGAAGVAGGVMTMAPSLGDVVSNAAGYYGASIYGNINRGALESMTRQSMGMGMTSAMGGSQAAAVLVNGMYYTPGTAAFKQSLAEVGGAALTMNMSNAVAASAIGGLYSGQMGASMAGMGIQNLDANGNPLSQVQIARQLYNRFMPNNNGVSILNNQKITQSSINQNFQQVLASQFQQMGYSPDQIAMFQYQFGQFAQGKNGDLSKATANPNNPVNAQMQINASNAKLMQTYEQPMLDGFQKAADLITNTVNPALSQFASSLGTAKGFLQGTGNVGAGAGMAASSVFNAGANIAETLAISKLLGQTGVSSLAMKGASGLLMKGASGLLKGSAIAGGSILAGNLIKGNSSKGSMRSRAGNAAKFAGIVAAIPGLGETILPEIIAGGIGYATGGGTQGFGASFGAKGGGSGPQSPIPGVSATTGYGATDPSMWSGAKNSHTGQDYPVPVGTPVQAAADGVVFDDAPGFEFGTYIQIDHMNGYQTLYGHLSSKSVKVGDHVRGGQVIGKSGQSGNVTGPHLHFEVRKGSNNPVDPSTFLNNSQLSSQVISGQTTQAAGTILGTGSQQSWAKDFLKGLGVPLTGTNVKAMTTWMGWEGGQWKNSAHYNPLNTTLGASGASDINSVGVKSYTSYQQGLQSNISTLKENQKGYAAIRAALMQGNNLSGVLSAVNQSAWGTHIPGYGGGTQGFGASIGGVSGGGSIVNNVSINVSLTGVSESDAKMFANRVKDLLKTDAHITAVGSR